MNAASRAHLKKRMKRVPAVMKAAVEDALGRQADRLVADIKAASPEKTGELVDSIERKPLDDGRVGFRVVGGKWGGKGWYIRFVEHGTKAGVKGERTTNASGRDRKVKRTHSGTQAQPFFWPTWRRNRRRVRAAVSRALKRAAKRL